MQQGSIAQDTMAVCAATILLVVLLLSALFLWTPARERQGPLPVRTAESQGQALPPFVF